MKRKFLAGKIVSRNDKDFLIKEEYGGIRLRGLIDVEIGQIVVVVGTEIDRNLYKVEQQEIISTQRHTEILTHRKMVAKFKQNSHSNSARSGILNSLPLPDKEFVFAFTAKKQYDPSIMQVDVTNLKTRFAPGSVFEALSEAPRTMSELKLIFPNDDVENIVLDLQCDGIAFELEGKICLL